MTLPGERRRVAFPGLRRCFYRHERSLIVVYLALLLGLNCLPFLWGWANRQWRLEQQLVSRYQQVWQVQYLEATEKASSGDIADGVAGFENLLTRMPEVQLRATHGRLRQDVKIELARLYLAAGKAKSAAALARQVTDTDPNDYRGWQVLGDALWARGREGEALASSQRSLGMEPNNPEIVERLVIRHVDRAEFAEAIARFDAYMAAVQVVQGFLYFTDSYPAFSSVQRVEVPVVVDGNPHTYRLHPGTPRELGEFRFAAMPKINGLRLEPAPREHITVELDRLEVRQKRDLFSMPPIPLVDVRTFDQVRTIGGMVPVGQGAWVSHGRRSGLEGPVAIPAPAEVASIEISLTAHKPVGARLARALQRAYHNLLADEEWAHRLEELRVWNEPEEGRASHDQLVSRDRPKAQERKADPAGERYSISVVGHVRRGPDQPDVIQPSLVAALPAIAATDLALVVTGDAVWEGTTARWNIFDTVLRRAVAVPVWIAVGNHDLHDGAPGRARSRFVDRYGPTFMVQRLGSTVVLVLDTELDGGDIAGDQLRMVLDTLDEVAEDPTVHHVIMAMHRVLWFADNPRYAEVARRANVSSVPQDGATGPKARNFRQHVLPKLRSLATTRRVMLFAGDVGTHIPAVYDRVDGVELVASGNRAQDSEWWWNHLVRVHLDGADAELEIVPLRGGNLPPLKDMTPEFWSRTPQLNPGGPR